MSPRTIVSVIRTAVYGGMAGFFAVKNPETWQMLDAAIVGGVMADYLTWMIRSVVLLPANIIHGCYDCIINVAFGWFVWRFVVNQSAFEGSDLGAAFFAFMLVLLFKILYYSIKFTAGGDDSSGD